MAPTQWRSISRWPKRAGPCPWSSVHAAAALSTSRRRGQTANGCTSQRAAGGGSRNATMCSPTVTHRRWPAEQMQCSYCSGPQRAEGDGTPRTRPRLSRQFDEQYNQRDADNDLAVHPHLALSALDECHPRVVVTSIPETLRCYRRPPQATVGGKRLDGARLVHVLTLVGLFVKEAIMPLGNHAKASVRRG